MTTKRCNDCGLHKPVTEFGKRRNRPCGLTSYCKSCLRLRWRRWAYREAS